MNGTLALVLLVTCRVNFFLNLDGSVQTGKTYLPLFFLMLRSSGSRRDGQRLHVGEGACRQATVRRLNCSPRRSIGIQRLVRGNAEASASFFGC